MNANVSIHSALEEPVAECTTYSGDETVDVCSNFRMDNVRYAV